MIAVLFEGWANSDHADEYFDLAEELRSMLNDIDGFISIERFESVSTPGKVLSMSFWRDEEAIAEWRRAKAHRKAQSAGRSRIFEDYRLRVAEVTRDYGMSDREQAPSDNRTVHG